MYCLWNFLFFACLTFLSLFGMFWRVFHDFSKIKPSNLTRNLPPLITNVTWTKKIWGGKEKGCIPFNELNEVYKDNTLWNKNNILDYKNRQGKKWEKILHLQIYHFHRVVSTPSNNAHIKVCFVSQAIWKSTKKYHRTMTMRQ